MNIEQDDLEREWQKRIDAEAQYAMRKAELARMCRAKDSSRRLKMFWFGAVVILAAIAACLHEAGCL